MRSFTPRVLRRVRSALLVTILIRAVVLSDPLIASAADALTPVPWDIEDGLRLATIHGNALMNPAVPVTTLSQLPAPGPVTRIRRMRTRVPTGTTFRVVVTAYSSTPDQTDVSPFITASGTHVHDGTIAANFLPFGTKVRFPDYSGNKAYTVEDRMHPRFSSRADIWFPTRAAAFRFGMRTLTMVVE